MNTLKNVVLVLAVLALIVAIVTLVVAWTRSKVVIGHNVVGRDTVIPVDSNYEQSRIDLANQLVSTEPFLDELREKLNQGGHEGVAQRLQPGCIKVLSGEKDSLVVATQLPGYSVERFDLASVSVVYEINDRSELGRRALRLNGEVQDICVEAARDAILRSRK